MRRKVLRSRDVFSAPQLGELLYVALVISIAIYCGLFLNVGNFNKGAPVC
jgi:hypothetical protein